MYVLPFVLRLRAAPAPPGEVTTLTSNNAVTAARLRHFVTHVTPTPTIETGPRRGTTHPLPGTVRFLSEHGEAAFHLRK